MPVNHHIVCHIGHLAEQNAITQHYSPALKVAYVRVCEFSNGSGACDWKGVCVCGTSISIAHQDHSGMMQRGSRDREVSV
jgi:hypothetical protein